jgi:hypothetical protein
MTTEHDDDQDLAARQAWADTVAALASRPLSRREQAEVDRYVREAKRHLRLEERKRGRR